MKCLAYLLIPALAGCVAVDPSYYRNTPSAKLCMDYLTYPSHNIHHPSRAAELERRGENCAAYVGAAQVRQQSNAASDAALWNLYNASRPQPVTSGTQTYIINGRAVTCTTTGLHTVCN